MSEEYKRKKHAPLPLGFTHGTKPSQCVKFFGYTDIKEDLFLLRL